MTAIEFLRRYRPGSLVKSSARGEYQLAEHDSFKINGESSVWHWKSRDIGGKSALKYLIYVEGVPFVEAVQLLCEESPMYIPVQHEAVERERPLFRLPNPALNNDRVTRYLLGRGISLPTIRYCIERKILYESAEYHNCVFLGKDPQGVPKYAALRGIYDYGNYISGQYSDGWGEGFEQRDIRVDDGMLAVHFWQEDGFKMTLSFEKIPKPEKNFLRPKMQLIGQDGNIFAIMGRASRLLKSSGQGDKAKEMRDRVMSCDSYQKALSIVSEYVETELSPSPTPKRDRGDAR